MNSEIYFDNSATTKPYNEVMEVLQKNFEEFYNPSAIYKNAVEVSKQTDLVRERILKSINAEKGDGLIFTSGGTEAINLAIKSSVRKNKNIVTTAYEHDATIKTVDFLQSEGYEIRKVMPNKDKGIEIEDIIAQIDENTSIVSVMFVNNETGHTIDIHRLGKLIKKSNPKTLFHIDAVQAYMKIKIDVKDAHADFLSISAHKIHSLKGTGALYSKNIQRLKPIIHGGGQELGVRAGTENVPGILAFGKAVEIGSRDFDKNGEHLSEIKKYFLEKLQNIEHCRINSPQNSANHILNVSFLGVPSEILLHTLESKGIFVSSGSACSSKKKESHVLKALGLKDDAVKTAIRFSFSAFNTKAEVDKVCDVLSNALGEIRTITKFRG